ncbi:MAG: thymidine phosphorylase [Acidobacteria bacterium]|nr:thymidine phosphorylase [Acidobacteriota bacterium]
MRAVDIIEKKRDGKELSPAEINFIVHGFTRGEVADYQMSALLMAIFLRGMSHQEIIALTHEMLHSGIVMDLSHLNRPRIDKHSTGGVGDKTSLVIAPVVAAAGISVPMISGRALGHSGGTLDKLEAIPGFRVNLSLAEYRRTLDQIGVALIGQTAEIAPADKQLYALRDVTATVPCQPLMAASIMSKKMAEGITGLVLDVKTGSGAFMQQEADAIALAKIMLGIAAGLHTDAVALVTDMNQPLGVAIGNALEVMEAFDTLKGKGPQDFNTLCRELSAEMLLMGRAAENIERARALYDEMISSGQAVDKMRQIIETQHGNPQVLDDYQLLPQAQNQTAVLAQQTGYVQMINTAAIGQASMLLGAGRLRLDTQIDFGVGVMMNAKLGDKVDQGAPLLTLHFNAASQVEEASAIINAAYQIGEARLEPPALIKTVLR